MAARIRRGNDVLSALPRDILEKIIDMITIEDATKFGMLSWDLRKTWCSNPRLVLDQRFVDECIGDKEDYESVLLEKLLGISFLHLDGSFLKVFASTKVSNGLFSVACTLRNLLLRMVSFDDSVQLSYSLALIRSSPKLETLHIQACSFGDDSKAHEITCMWKVATEGIMPNLRMVKMFGLRGLKEELLLIGTIISSSPLLNTIFLEFKVDKWQNNIILLSLNHMARASLNLRWEMRMGDLRTW